MSLYTAKAFISSIEQRTSIPLRTGLSYGHADFLGHDSHHDVCQMSCSLQLY